VSANLQVISPELREKCINTIRFLAVDGVEKANSDIRACPWRLRLWLIISGPRSCATIPGIPNGPTGTVLFLSSGHGSLLLYAMLFLTGYDLPLDELKKIPGNGTA
jgi:transketolase